MFNFYYIILQNSELIKVSSAWPDEKTQRQCQGVNVVLDSNCMFC